MTIRVVLTPKECNHELVEGRLVKGFDKLNLTFIKSLLQK